MQYIHFWGGLYGGATYSYYIAVPDDFEEMDIEEMSREYARENAEEFSYLATGWDMEW